MKATREKHMDRIIDAMIDTFATRGFFRGSVIQHEMQEIALERGGERAEKVRAYRARRAAEDAEREAARLRGDDD